MPKAPTTKINEELSQIEAIIAEHPDGLGRDSVSAAYTQRHKATLPNRTLQRRIEELAIQGRVTQKGDGPSTHYLAANPANRAATAEEGYVPLSGPGRKIRDLVRAPISERKPVGYDPDWLFAYKPGKTWYLPKSVRVRLHEIGSTQQETLPAGTFARDVLGRLLIDLAWASSRLEGNTYTRLDTQNLIEFGQRAEGKDAAEAQMILNHKFAIELLVSDAEPAEFSRRTLEGLHAALSENLLGDPAGEGRLRTRPVSITGTSYTPSAIPQVIRECFDRIIECAKEIPDAFECAFFAMTHIPYLQPFADVNKRTSRLAANIPLIAGNLCPLSFVDVPERAYVEGTLAVYERCRTDLLRDVFVFAYERSCAQYRVVRESLPHPDPIRLRYRAELATAVAETVREEEAPRLESMQARGERLGIAHSDAQAFAERALEIAVNLNAGSAHRYGLRPSEFEAWQKRYRTA